MRFNEDMLDALTLVSFMIGVANYNENLTQNDKSDGPHTWTSKFPGPNLRSQDNKSGRREWADL